MIRILSISFVLYDKYISAKYMRRAEGIIFLVNLLKFESVIKIPYYCYVL